MAADQNRSSLADHLGASPEDLHQYRFLKTGREPDEVHCRERPCSHGENVRKGVGGGNASVSARVVDHRGEEIDRLHERLLFADAVDAGIGEGNRRREEVRILGLR